MNRGLNTAVCQDLVLNKWSWLGSLGRLPRSKKNEKLENFISELQRLTIHHERGQEGDDYYRLGGSDTKEDDDDEHKAKGSSAKNQEAKAKEDDSDTKEEDYNEQKAKGSSAKKQEAKAKEGDSHNEQNGDK
jgi:H+-transporting ATPase